MGKAKKVDGQLPHKHLRARISYLYQAAAYFQGANSEHSPPFKGTVEEVVKEDVSSLLSGIPVRPEPTTNKNSHPDPSSRGREGVQGKDAAPSTDSGQSHRFVNHLRAVALKGQIRLSSTTKHSTCKKCDCLLVAGSTSTKEIENKSYGGKKPWADVVVVTCNTCGSKKRFPIGAKRQLRKPVRNKQSTDTSNDEATTSVKG